GSIGNFFDYFPKTGSFECNPPFSETLMDNMVTHIENLLQSSDQPLNFIIILPDWKDASANIRLSKSKYLREQAIAEARKHEYRDINQEMHFQAIHDSIIFILQNDAGFKLWKPNKNKLNGLIENFLRSEERRVGKESRI